MAIREVAKHCSTSQSAQAHLDVAAPLESRIVRSFSTFAFPAWTHGFFGDGPRPWWFPSLDDSCLTRRVALKKLASDCSPKGHDQVEVLQHDRKNPKRQPTTIPRQAATRQVDTEDLSKTTTPASRRRRRPTHPPNARLTSSTPDLSTSPVHSGVRTDRATRRKARPDRHKRSRPPQAWDKQSSTPIHPITHQRPQHSRRSIVVFGCAPAS